MIEWIECGIQQKLIVPFATHDWGSFYIPETEHIAIQLMKSNLTISDQLSLLLVLYGIIIIVIITILNYY